MAWPVSAAAADTLTTARRGAAIRVEVWNGNTYLQDLQITGGSVTEDETASPRRTCTLTVEDVTLVPNAPGDLLHPLSGNELRPYRGIVIPGDVTVTTTLVEELNPVVGYTVQDYDDQGSWDSGTGWDATPTQLVTADAVQNDYDNPADWDTGVAWDAPNVTDVLTYVTTSTVTEGADTILWVPLGVFRMTQPSTTYNGASTIITINGHDRSSEISLRKWAGAYVIPAAQTVDTAIVQILTGRWASTTPALVFNVAPTSTVVPVGTVLGVDFTSSGTQATTGSTSGNDPWADCVALATSIGCELFFDRTGTVVMRPVPLATTVPVTSQFVDGVNSVLVNQVVRELDETTVVNQIIMIGTGATVTNTDGSTSPGAPVVAVASDLNPLSPTYIYGNIGVRPAFLTNSAVSDVATCQAAANAALALGLASLDDTSFEAIPDPTVDAGDCAALVEPAVQAASTYIISAVTHPLDTTSTMQVTNRSASVSTVSGAMA